MPHIQRQLGFLIATAALLSGCAVTGPSPADTESALTSCVSGINQYRAKVNLPPLERSGALESFALDSATVDGKAGVPHTHFRDTGGGGVASAETELLGWKNGSIQATLDQGFANMWNEGPGGVHYDVFVGPYTQVGCGVYIGDNGVTVAQDFR